MSTCLLTRLFFGFLASALALVDCSAAPTWTEVSGTTFKGDPSSVFGPFAIFNTGSGTGRRVLFRSLPPGECVRFEKELAELPALSSDWAKARSQVSADLDGRSYRLENQKLVEASFKGVPEPEVFVLIFASSWDGSSYRVSNLFQSTYHRLKRLYGSRMETVFFGVRHDGKGQSDVARATNMPWLIADYDRQESIKVFTRNAPTQGTLMMLVNRHGVPLAHAAVDTIQAQKKFCDQLGAFMAARDELNPQFWEDRSRYEQATRPMRFAQGATPPLMLGHHLRSAAFRARGIKEVVARVEVAADGSVTSARITSEADRLGELKEQVELVLKEATPFLPALQDGKPVAAGYDFQFRVDDTPQGDVDRAWLFSTGRKEIAINSWLLLRPIPVPAEEFGGVDHVTKEGVVVMGKMEVGTAPVSRKAQLNAFNSDFFGESGAANVKPVVGESQVIDGKSYKWESHVPNDGLVDFASAAGSSYSVGYGWAEFESPSAGLAYLGFGSDDGVKIWLNGALVHDRWVRRPSRIDDDIVPLQLVAGKNHILVKIQNASGEWSFLGRIRR